MQQENSPKLMILDWTMPYIEGPELCEMLRNKEGESTNPAYVILLTAHSSKDRIVTGLEAGANDYITKPFDESEFRARINVGLRVLSLQKALEKKVTDLEKSFAEINILQGIVPICSYCKKIRNDGDYWEQVEEYITNHSEAAFSHSICPVCYEEHIIPQLDAVKDIKPSDKL